MADHWRGLVFVKQTVSLSAVLSGFSLRNLRDLCVGGEKAFKDNHRRDAEVAEEAQRFQIVSLRARCLPFLKRNKTQTNSLRYNFCVTNKGTNTADHQKLDPVKAFQDVAGGEAQDDRAAVRTSGRRRSLEQSINQPAHLFRRERHVDFDRGVTGERGGDVVAQGFAGAAFFLGVNCLEKFGEHVARFTRREIGRRGFDGDSAAGETHEFKTIAFKFRGDRVERLPSARA